MTVETAKAMQLRLFPTVGWMSVMGGHRTAPTLPDICMTLKSAMNGAADAWPTHEMRQARTMLALRLREWTPNPWETREDRSVARCDADVDEAVRQLVVAMVAMCDAWITENKTTTEELP